MGYNRSQDITPYLGHGTLDKHRLIMAFSGLRSDFLLGASAALHASRGHAPPPSRQRTSIGLLNGSRKEGRKKKNGGVSLLPSGCRWPRAPPKKQKTKLPEIYVCGCEQASARLVRLIGIRQHPAAEDGRGVRFVWLMAEPIRKHRLGLVPMTETLLQITFGPIAGRRRATTSCTTTECVGFLMHWQVWDVLKKFTLPFKCPIYIYMYIYLFFIFFFSGRLANIR